MRSLFAGGSQRVSVEASLQVPVAPGQALDERASCFVCGLLTPLQLWKGDAPGHVNVCRGMPGAGAASCSQHAAIGASVWAAVPRPGPQLALAWPANREASLHWTFGIGQESTSKFGTGRSRSLQRPYNSQLAPAPSMHTNAHQHAHCACQPHTCLRVRPCAHTHMVAQRGCELVGREPAGRQGQALSLRAVHWPAGGHRIVLH